MLFTVSYSKSLSDYLPNSFVILVEYVKITTVTLMLIYLLHLYILSKNCPQCLCLIFSFISCFENHCRIMRFVFLPLLFPVVLHQRADTSYFYNPQLFLQPYTFSVELSSGWNIIKFSIWMIKSLSRNLFASLKSQFWEIK